MPCLLSQAAKEMCLALLRMVRWFFEEQDAMGEAERQRFYYVMLSSPPMK
jgi:hypothetical protein